MIELTGLAHREKEFLGGCDQTCGPVESSLSPVQYTEARSGLGKLGGGDAGVADAVGWGIFGTLKNAYWLSSLQK